MKKLYLHIGQPKTATTTIQDFLLQNQAILRTEGWLYPNAGRQYLAHHHLANFFRPDPLYWIQVVDPAACYGALLDEVASSGCDNVIMSSEALYFTPDPSLIPAYFKDFRVVPVVFLRRQDEWLESAYREGRKNGEHRISIEAYRDLMTPAMDYATLLQKWQACFPQDKIIVGTFEKAASTLPVEHEFLRCIGAKLKSKLPRARVQNETFSRDALEFYTGFEESPRVGVKHEVFKAALAEYSRTHKDPVEFKKVLPPSEAIRIVEEFTPGNDAVARDFLPAGQALFSAPPASADTPWKPYPGLTTGSAVRIGEALANQVYDLYLDALNNRSRKTEPAGLVFVGGLDPSDVQRVQTLLCAADNANEPCPAASFLRPIVHGFAVGTQNWQRETSAFFESHEEYRRHIRFDLVRGLNQMSRRLNAPDVLVLHDAQLARLFYWLQRLVGAKARLVTVIRNPLEIVGSRKADADAAGRSFTRSEALAIANDYMHCYAHLNAADLGNSVFPLRREDLADTATLEKLWAFAGLTGRPAGGVPPSRDEPGGPDGRPDPLDPELSAAVTETCGRLMERFGWA